MEISNEMIFYLGIALSAVSLVCMIIGLVMIKFHKLSLDRRLDEEYGKENGKKG